MISGGTPAQLTVEFGDATYHQEFQDQILQFIKEVEEDPNMAHAPLNSLAETATTALEDAASAATVVDNTIAAGLVNYMRDIIVDAPFDHWFDISIGMRMNLVIPTDQSEPSNQVGEATKLLNSFMQDAAVNQLQYYDRKYVEDKAFVITAPKYGTWIPGWQGNKDGSDDQYWLCIPLEYVEYNLSDYIYEFQNIDTTDPNWELYAKNSPWAIILNEQIGPYEDICTVTDGDFDHPKTPSGICAGNDLGGSGRTFCAHDLSHISDFFSTIWDGTKLANSSTPDMPGGTLL